MIARLVLTAALVIPSAVFAAGAADGSSSQPAVVSGTITAIDGSAMTVKDKAGAETRLTFKPDLKVSSVRPAGPATIKAGTDAIMVTKPQSDGVEAVVIIRLIQPEVVTDPEGVRPGPQPGTTMIVGKVAPAKETAAGLELDVTSAGATRHVLLPSGATVLETYALGRDALKVGVSVTSQLIREPDGSARTGALMVMREGAGPPR